MIIYDQEVKDGLSESIAQNTSVAFKCIASKFEPLIETDIVKKSIAGFIEDGRNFDLYHFSSILASVNENKNDDWFLPEEICAARHTPIHKQVNYGHNEKDIIGVITGTTVINNDGDLILTELDIPSIKDIVSHAVIWSYWEDDDLKSRFNSIVSSIENDELFVSMESLFKNFDYMLIKDGKRSIVKRNKETAFLTKYLRIYNKESDGTYNGHRIYRLLRDFTFSGKALVDNPANSRSIISDELMNIEEKSIAKDINELNQSVETAGVTKLLAENIMELNETVFNAVKAELAQAKAELESYKKTEAEKTEAAISQLKAENESLQKQVAEMTQLAQAAKDEMKSKIEEANCEKEVMKEECETKVAEANIKVATLESEKATAARLVKLTAANVESAKAEEILKTWASASDEQFNQVVAILAVAPAPKTDKDFDLQSTHASTETVNPNGDSVPDKAVAQEKLLAEKIAAQFKFTKKNKGSK